MKVTCQSCGAQYNLPDEKIRGRKAKVRCKKCSERIVVDGTALLNFEDEDEATRVMQTSSFTESGDLLWTVNLSDDEQLDMTEAEVLSGWRDGTLSDDAYVWREGMDEWMPILEAPVLGEAIRAIDPRAGSSVGTAPEPTPEPEPQPATPIAAPVTREASAPAHAFTPIADAIPTPHPSDAFGSRPSAPSPSNYPKPKAHRSEDTSKAFSFALGSSTGAAAKKPQSRVPAAPAPSLFDKPASTAPAAHAASGPAPEASENSVMFSLDALKAAAAVEPQKPRAAAVDQVRVNEDILTLGAPSRFDDNSMPLIDVEVPPPARDDTRMAAAAPVLAAPPKSNNGVWYGFAGAAVLALGVGAFFGLRSDPPVVERTGVAATGSPETALASTSTSPETSTEPSTETTSNAAASVTGPADSDEAQAQGPKPSPGPSPNVAAAGPKPSPGPSPAPEPKDKPSPSPAVAQAPKEKPGTPFNIGAAKSALSSAAASAKGCKAPAGPFGSGKVQVTFAPSGKVTSALIVSGPFGGTPVGSCVARTFRSASVPAFEGGAKTVAKSFTIQ